MHWVRVALLSQRVVDVDAVEQLFFHLAAEGGAYLRVGADVGEWLVEALGDHGQAAGGIDDVT